MGLAQQYAKTYNIILAAKDARTVVAGKGKIPYLNLSGNSAMAKAGSGDVLAGMITGSLRLVWSGLRRRHLACCPLDCGGDEQETAMGLTAYLRQI